MKLLKNAKDIENFNKAVDACRYDVILRSADGREEYNLKSVISRCVATGELCREHGDEYEFFCDSRSDEGYMMRFLYSLSRTEGDAHGGAEKKIA